MLLATRGHHIHRRIQKGSSVNCGPVKFFYSGTVYTLPTSHRMPQSSSITWTAWLKQVNVTARERTPPSVKKLLGGVFSGTGVGVGIERAPKSPGVPRSGVEAGPSGFRLPRGSGDGPGREGM